MSIQTTVVIFAILAAWGLFTIVAVDIVLTTQRLRLVEDAYRTPLHTSQVKEDVSIQVHPIRVNDSSIWHRG